MSTSGKAIECRAAVMMKPGEPLQVRNVTVDPPKAKEVRVKMVACGICQTDNHFGLGEEFDASEKPIPYDEPMILGHEGGGIVESVGEGVTSVKPGDVVIANFMLQCDDCALCRHVPKTNFCLAGNIDTIWWQADGTSRTHVDGKGVVNLLGTGLFSEYVVLREAGVTKVPESTDLKKACLIGCGVSTGYGSAVNLAKVHPGSTCVVWGLGAIGLSVVLGCKANGAANIVGLDTNPGKFEVARKMGCTDCYNPLDVNVEDMFARKVDYAFDAVGHEQICNTALKCLLPWGTLVVIGLAKKDAVIRVSPNKILPGQTVTAGFFGGYRGRSGISDLVAKFNDGELCLDPLVTRYYNLDEINDGFEALRAGKLIRGIVLF